VGRFFVSEKQVYFGDFLLDFGRFQLSRGARLIKLESQPLQLLMFLVENRGQLVTREQIADALWGKDIFVDVEQGINTAIRKVRQVLEDDPGQPHYLQTVVGRGYRFVAAAEVRELDAPLMVTAEDLGRAIMTAAGLDPNDLNDSSKWRRET
jgi:DNA-binding winged helix-turn-helix (wHTH) protein